MNFKILFIFLFLLLFFIFTGCQNAFNVFNKNGTNYEKGLQYTKVKAIIYKNQTKAIINITYLNLVDTKKWDNEYQNFLVGIYISEDNELKNTQYINNTRYKLTINDISFTKYKELKKDDKLYKSIPLLNPWAKYYVMSIYKNKKNKNIVLKYTNPNFGFILLSFEK
jgi:hypothetical protein